MRIYLAELRENDWETEWFTVGAYSTRENAEKALVNYLREEGEEVLSFETYDALEDAEYEMNISFLDIDADYLA